MVFFGSKAKAEPASATATLDHPAPTEIGSGTENPADAAPIIARHPFFDARTQLAGYKLAYRTAKAADNSDADTVAVRSLVHLFLDVGLDSLVGAAKAHLELSPALLLGKVSLPDLQDRLVLEFPAVLAAETRYVEGARKLIDQGYSISISCAAYQRELEPILKLVNLVNVDLTRVAAGKLIEVVATLKRFPVKLLADQVSDLPAFHKSTELGFTWFRGFFFAQPNYVVGQKLPESRVGVMRLMASLQKPNLVFDELENIVRNDVALSFRLLKFINSASFGLSREITSIRQALTLIGLVRLRQLATLFSIAAVDGKPNELLVTALVRAKTCELLAKHVKGCEADVLFTVGLFSLLDVMLDQPMATVLGMLPLADSVTNAVLKLEGPMGTILNAVRAFERGDWAALDAAPALVQPLRSTYLQAIKWAAEVQPSLFYKAPR